MRGRLVLEDGTAFQGEAFGAEGLAVGEVVFNTGMTGYQEVLTDPSYTGQLVVMTYPLIGNYGINTSDAESHQPHVRGFLVREWETLPSHWRSEGSVEEYLKRAGILGLSGLDTRALTRHLRRAGTMMGVLTTGAETEAELQLMAQRFRLREPVWAVTTPEPYEITAAGPRVVVVDLGVKQNILRSLQQLRCHAIVVPAQTTAEEILAWRPDGVLFSNGPGDPAELDEVIGTIQTLGGEFPLFGICLGMQVLALAFGAKTYKLTFGHRGVNHPVKDLVTGRVYITCQNHGYAVTTESLDEAVWEVTHLHLNDETVEGLRHRHLPVFGVQYHPEACPGPQESHYLFGEFLEEMQGTGAAV